MHEMPPQDFDRLFAGLDGLFQNTQPGASTQCNKEYRYSRVVTTQVVGPYGRSHVTTSAYGPDGQPQDPAAAKTCDATAFDFDNLFARFDESFRHARRPTPPTPDTRFSGAASSIPVVTPVAKDDLQHCHGIAIATPVGCLSFASEEAIGRLGRTDVGVGALERAVNVLEEQWQKVQTQTSVARNRLGAIETRMKAIEFEEVDNVQTSDLHSGKEQAKSMKKVQLKRLEALFGRVDALFTELR